MVVGSSSGTSALYQALPPPWTPVRIGWGKGSMKACLIARFSGTTRTLDRWTSVPMEDPPFRLSSREGFQRPSGGVLAGGDAVGDPHAVIRAAGEREARERGDPGLVAGHGCRGG